MFAHLADSFKDTLSSFGLETFLTDTFEVPFHSIECDVIILFGIVGSLKGVLTFEYDENATHSILSTMVPGAENQPLGEVSLSALAEIGNICAGLFLSRCKREGTDITPPTIVMGKNIKAMVNNNKTYRSYLSLASGTIVISLSFS